MFVMLRGEGAIGKEGWVEEEAKIEEFIAAIYHTFLVPPFFIGIGTMQRTKWEESLVHLTNEHVHILLDIIIPKRYFSMRSVEEWPEQQISPQNQVFNKISNEDNEWNVYFRILVFWKLL